MPPLQQLTFFHPRHQFQSRSRPIHFLSFFFMFAYFLLSIGQIARPVHPAARPVHPAARPVRRGRRLGRPVTAPVDGRRSAVGGRRPGGPEARRPGQPPGLPVVGSTSGRAVTRLTPAAKRLRAGGGCHRHRPCYGTYEYSQSDSMVFIYYHLLPHIGYL